MGAGGETGMLELVLIISGGLLLWFAVRLRAPDPISLVEVGVDYSCPLKKVKRITTEVAREGMEEVPGGVLSFRPLVRYHTFADSSVDFTVTLRAKE